MHHSPILGVMGRTIGISARSSALCVALLFAGSAYSTPSYHIEITTPRGIYKIFPGGMPSGNREMTLVFHKDGTFSMVGLPLGVARIRFVASRAFFQSPIRQKPSFLFLDYRVTSEESKIRHEQIARANQDSVGTHEVTIEVLKPNTEISGKFAWSTDTGGVVPLDDWAARVEEN